MPQTISPEALAILKDGVLDGKKLKITDRALDRELYEEVAEAVKRLGGKWKGGRTKAFAFELDPAEQFQIMLESGEMPPDNPLDYFSSTPVVCERIAALVNTACRVESILEPQAGTGALCKVGKSLYPEAEVQAVEFDEYRARHLQRLGFNVHQGDFLEWAASALKRYGLILMNPPFNNGAAKHVYVEHVCAALELLAEDGLLVSVVPSGFEYRKDKKVREFRELVEARGGWRKLPQAAFKDSGTGTGATLIWINGPTRPVEFYPNPPPDPPPEIEPEPEYKPLNELLDDLEKITRDAAECTKTLKAELASIGCMDLLAQADEMIDDDDELFKLIAELKELDSTWETVTSELKQELAEVFDPPPTPTPELELEPELESKPEFTFEPIKLKRKQAKNLTEGETENALQGCLF